MNPKQLKKLKKRIKKAQKVLQQPKYIDQRKEFGHWECDLVLGHKTKDDEVPMSGWCSGSEVDG